MKKYTPKKASAKSAKSATAVEAPAKRVLKKKKKRSGNLALERRADGIPVRFINLVSRFSQDTQDRVFGIVLEHRGELKERPSLVSISRLLAEHGVDYDPYAGTLVANVQPASAQPEPIQGEAVQPEAGSPEPIKGEVVRPSRYLRLRGKCSEGVSVVLSGTKSLLSRTKDVVGSVRQHHRESRTMVQNHRWGQVAITVGASGGIVVCVAGLLVYQGLAYATEQLLAAAVDVCRASYRTAAVARAAISSRLEKLSQKPEASAALGA
jgi:hypothetical protein